MPCLLTRQNFVNFFLKRSPRVKIWHLKKEYILRFFSCQYSTRIPHSPEPCGWIKILRTISETPVNYFKIWPAVPEEKILIELLKKNPFHCHGNQSFWWKLILWTGFKKDLPRNISKKLAKQFRRRCLKKLLTKHNRHRTTLKAPLEYVVHRSAETREPWWSWVCSPEPSGLWF